MDTIILAAKMLLHVATGLFVFYLMGRVWAKAMRDGKGSGEVNIIIITPPEGGLPTIEAGRAMSTKHKLRTIFMGGKK